LSRTGAQHRGALIRVVDLARLVEHSDAAVQSVTIGLPALRQHLRAAARRRDVCESQANLGALAVLGSGPGKKRATRRGSSARTL
jgi:hypothetical protein